jgi:hypothetical protein
MVGKNEHKRKKIQMNKKNKKKTKKKKKKKEKKMNAKKIFTKN